jgi:hypothetical protein
MRSACLVAAALLPLATVAYAQVPDQPDLDVLFIEQWPVYPGYGFAYPGNVPTLVKPGTGVGGKAPEYCYTRQEYEALVKTRPADGEQLTFTAYVANKGGAAAPAADYVFKLDDQVLERGTLPALKPGEQKTVAVKWAYQSGRHYVSFEADPDKKIAEISRVNNVRRDPTFGFVLTITAGKGGEYEAFGTTKNMVGTYSFDDWCQAHIDKWREHFRAARYPSTPDGVQADLRFNHIFPLDEGPEYQDYVKRGGWVNWRIYWPAEGIRKSYAAGIDNGLIHELAHQCGIIDSYQIGLGALDNLARDPETGWTIEIPYSDHRCKFSSMMGGGYREELKGAFSEFEAAAFDATLRTWGNHAGFGVYLFDMPESNIVQFLDNRGKPLADAVLTIWQQWASPEEGNVISRKTNITTPKCVHLDANGCFNLGHNPYDTLWVVGGTCTLMYCVRAYEQKEYHFVDVREFNLAYWRGDTKQHVYIYQTNIAPLGSPDKPQKVVVNPEGSDRTHARLTWQPAATAAKPLKAYRIRGNRDYLSALHEPTFEVIKEVGATASEDTVELEPDADFTWLTVTAVAEDGTESACAAPVMWPVMQQVRSGLVRPIGTAIGPDGAVYVVDNHQGTVFGVDAKGNLLNFSDTAMIGSGVPHGITVTRDNRIFVSGAGGSGITEITPAGRVVRSFAGSREKSTTPGKMSLAFAIACDTQGRLYVSDLDSHTIQVYKPAGELLATLDAKLEDNRGLGVTERDGKVLVAVAVAARKVVTVLTLNTSDLKVVDTQEVKSEVTPLCADFDAAGNLYVGTQGGIDRYQGGKKTGHWQSAFNRKGHQVWGLKTEGDRLVCTEGSDNEKHWMNAKLADFEPAK